MWTYDHFSLKKGSKKRTINPLKKVHADVFLKQEELIKLDGFSVEVYEFATEDGAFVSMWRIHRVKGKKRDLKPCPVIIQHGLLDCSVTWFLHADKNKCLPYMLAQEGYDVWVGNNRGTKHSSRNSHSQGYWDYNFDHFVQYDQPALINGVLQQTHKKQVIYIGHSQGSAQLLAALGVHPQLGHKVRCFVGMGTALGLEGLKGHKLIDLLSKMKVCQIMQKIGFRTVLILPSWFCKLTGVLIYTTKLYGKLFMGIVESLCGSPKVLNMDLARFGVVISQQPGGSSIPNALHWVQMYRSQKFCRFDYGPTKNLQKYGCVEPPEYNLAHLEEVNFNMHLFQGSKDSVLTNENMGLIEKRVKQDRLKIIQVEEYAHLDYVWGMSAWKDVYLPILQLLKLQENEAAKEEDALLTSDSE